ncbi:MAG: dTMP kinase [Candidatus Vogelbacteria bacterium]|nr:dTMP kinase [Candidatus Vogelbacteria bacterium]
MGEKPGKFIVLEGMDGSGKGEVLRIVRAWLPVELPDHQFVFTFEPGGTEVGNEIRAILQKNRDHDIHVVADVLLFLASRVEHLSKLIIPAIEDGTDVLCDRYEASTNAFQIHGREHREQASLLSRLNNLLRIKKPDIYILLDQEPAISRERANQGRVEAKSRFDVKPLDFYIRVRDAYLDFMANCNSRIVYVGPAKTPDQVADEVMTHLREFFSEDK